MDLGCQVNTQFYTRLGVETLLSSPAKWILKLEDKLLTKTLPIANVVGKDSENRIFSQPQQSPINTQGAMAVKNTTVTPNFSF